MEYQNKLKRDCTIQDKNTYKESVHKFKEQVYEQKTIENQKAQESRKKIIEKLIKLEESKKEYSKKQYKEKVEIKDKHVQENMKLLKSLEKKEQEVLERLKNTYGEHDKELQRLETAINMSKQVYYERAPASPTHARPSIQNNNSKYCDLNVIKELSKFNRSYLKIIMVSNPYTIVAREMHPPREGGCISWTINSWDTSPPPLFHFDKFNGIRIIRKTKKLNS